VPNGDREALGLCAVEGGVVPLLGIIRVEPMRAACHRGRIPIVTDARIILSIVDYLLGNHQSKQMALL
jgi:hypothetical protein